MSGLPKLEYCCTVWDPAQQNHINQLEMVQCRAARWVMADYSPLSSVTKMINHLKWQELAQRRQQARLILLYKIVHSLVLVNRANYIKMQRDNIHICNIYATQQYHQSSFFPRTIRQWNSDSVLKAITIQSFKNGLSTHIAHNDIF